MDPKGQPLKFQSAVNGICRLQWEEADGTELIKLVETTGTLHPVHSYSGSKPTYYNRVVKEKWNSGALKMDAYLRDPATDVTHRVRGTAGGDRLNVDYPVSTYTASLSTLNVIFNATVSEDATFGSIDLTDFYLGTPLPEPSFIRKPVGRPTQHKGGRGDGVDRGAEPRS